MRSPVRKLLLADPANEVRYVAREATVFEAAEAMTHHDVGALVVLADGRPCGMLSERDVSRTVASGKDPRTTWVSEAMSPALLTITPETTVEEALAVVTQTGCRHLPVADEERLIGVISAMHLMRWVVREREFEISDLIGYITGR